MGIEWSRTVLRYNSERERERAKERKGIKKERGRERGERNRERDREREREREEERVSPGREWHQIGGCDKRGVERGTCVCIDFYLIYLFCRKVSIDLTLLSFHCLSVIETSNQFAVLNTECMSAGDHSNQTDRYSSPPSELFVLPLASGVCGINAFRQSIMTE